MQTPTKYRAQNPSVRPLAPRAGNRWQPVKRTRRRRRAMRAAGIQVDRRLRQRAFEIADVLSVTTGRLVSRQRIGGVYEILNFMTGESLFTHTLPRAARWARPILALQFPALAAEMYPPPPEGADVGAYIAEWLSAMERRHGRIVTVRAPSDGWRQSMNPIAELAVARSRAA